MEEIITNHEVPRQVIYCGDARPSDFLDPEKSKPQRLICIFPGSPGVGYWYIPFAERLYKKTSIPVWILSYAGMTMKLECPDSSQFPELYVSDGQIKQYKEIIIRYLKDISVILLAHSFGCHITLQVMLDEQCAQIIQNAYLLFPVIERIDQVKGANDYLPVVTTIRHLTRTVMPFLDVIPLMKVIFAKAMYFFYRKREVLKAFHEWADTQTLGIAVIIFNDMMETLKNRNNIKIVEKYMDKIKLYYGSNDDWSPAQFCEDLRRDVPGVRSFICAQGIDHGFMAHNMQEMADIVQEWIEEDVRE